MTTTLHAFLRNANEKFAFDHAGHALSFEANAKGDVVGEVPDEIVDDILDKASCAYRLYGEPPKVKAADKPATFVLAADDGETLDLAELNDEALRQFANEQELPKPHHMVKGDKLRQYIIDGVRAKKPPEA